jgi:hypothetical protein
LAHNLIGTALWQRDEVSHHAAKYGFSEDAFSFFCSIFHD